MSKSARFVKLAVPFDGAVTGRNSLVGATVIGDHLGAAPEFLNDSAARATTTNVRWLVFERPEAQPRPARTTKPRKERKPKTQPTSPSAPASTEEAYRG